MFPFRTQFQDGWHLRRQFHQMMIQKWNPRLQSPGHGHIIHPFDGIIDNQGGDIHAQDLVDKGVSARLGQQFGDPL